MTAKRVLITGGSQGIGAALVERMCSAGNTVVFTGRHKERIATVAGDTGASGIRADVSSDEDNARVVAECTDRMGGVDVLVNNAAFPYNAKIGEFDVDRMRELFATNVFGVVDLTNRIVPLMKAQAEGDIVNIASTSGMKGNKTGTAYAGSKWAIRGISQCWQAELRPHGGDQCLSIRGPDRLGWPDRPEQPEQALRRGYCRHDHGCAQHAPTGALARAGGVCKQPVERGLARIIQEGSDIGRKTKASAWYKCC